MNITFTGIPGEDEVKDLNMYGYHFHKGQSVDVQDKQAQAALSNHPFFKGGEAKLTDVILPQTIPSVQPTLLVSDGHQSTTLVEVDAINNDPRMLPGHRVSVEEVLRAKGDEHGEHFRVEPEGTEEDRSPRRGRKRAG